MHPPRIRLAGPPQRGCTRRVFDTAMTPDPAFSLPKPIILTPAQFGHRIGLSADTICRYIRSGAIPARFVHRPSPRKTQIDFAALDWFLAECRRQRRARHHEGRMVLSEMTFADMTALAKEIMARGFSEDVALKIASRLDVIEEETPGGKWVIRDDSGSVIAIIDPV